jgi:hypothetical protein
MSKDRVVIKDAALAARIAEIAERRLAEQPLTAYYYTFEGAQFAGLMVGQGGMEIYISRRTCGNQITYNFAFNNGSDTPMQMVAVEVEDAQLKLGHVTQDELDSLFELVATYPALPYRKVPYGYVQDGVVIAILVSSYVESALKDLRSGLFCYVLEGHELPKEWFVQKGDDKARSNRFWRAVKSGQLVRLSDRLNACDGWFACDGRTPPTFEPECSDGKQPTLGGTYRLWPVTERDPQNFGVKIAKRWGVVRYTSRGYFN